MLSKFKSKEACEKLLPIRGMSEEEEILLYFEMLEARDDLGEFKQALGSPLFSPLSQLRAGNKELLIRAVSVLSKAKEWQMVYDLAKSCLSEKDNQGNPSPRASDESTWRRLIEAATHILPSNPRSAAATPRL
jgi:hypothetical protein